jgi:hypothetical protein
MHCMVLCLWFFAWHPADCDPASRLGIRFIGTVWDPATLEGYCRFRSLSCTPLLLDPAFSKAANCASPAEVRGWTGFPRHCVRKAWEGRRDVRSNSEAVRWISAGNQSLSRRVQREAGLASWRSVPPGAQRQRPRSGQRIDRGRTSYRRSGLAGRTITEP